MDNMEKRRGKEGYLFCDVTKMDCDCDTIRSSQNKTGGGGGTKKRVEILEAYCWITSAQGCLVDGMVVLAVAVAM